MPASIYLGCRAGVSRVASRRRVCGPLGRVGVSTRRMERLVEPLGVTGLSNSQVSAMAAELDEQHTGGRRVRCRDETNGQSDGNGCNGSPIAIADNGYNPEGHRASSG
jgi:hypothetical protein